MAEEFVMATDIDDESGKPVPKVMMVTTGTESHIADTFIMAVAVDDVTGKPMPKVQVVGGVGGGTVDLTPITTRLDAVEATNGTQTTNITNLTNRVSAVEGVNNTQNTNITNLTNRISALETQNLELIARIEALETPTQ